MANTDKDILITPNIGSSNDPKIEFKGASSTVGPSTITATIYPLEGGTLSFDGSQGSLFSISNNLTSGSIFSVNPISGIPIIDINADRTIALNPYGGNTGIGLTNPSYKLDVNGSVGIRNTLGISESGASGNRLLISTSASGAVFNQNDNSNILFQTQGATRFTIAHSSGDVTATGTVNATALVITGGRVTVRTGGVNTYGIVSGYDNNNHLMTMRASISGSTSSPTLTAGHYMCFVEYAGVNDFEGWYFKSSSSGNYEEIARITRTNITYNGNIVLHAGNYNSYAPTLTGTGASGTWSINITGNANSADLIDGIAFRNSNSTSPITAPDTLDSNGIGYVNAGISLYSQTDGALYAQAYNSTWQHQIYGDYRTGQIAIRGKNSGTWQEWRRVLDNTSYSASNSWTPNYSGVSPSFVPGTFTKSGGANSWDSHVYSTEGYITNVYVSCSAAQTNGSIMFGLNSDPTANADYSSLDYAIYFTGSADILIYESGASIGNYGTYATTDILSIVYDGTHIIYYKNNTILRRVARAISTTKLYFDTSFYTPNSSITGVSYGTFNTPDFKPSNDQYQVDINAPAAANGSWTTASSDDEWGNPKFDKIYNGYRWADASGADVWVQYNVPSGMKSAWISQLCWDTGGYVDIYGVQSGGQLVFLRRINTRQTVENTDEGVNHDGSTVTFAASGLDDYTAIRFIVKSGRFHLTGLSFSSADNEGTEGVGMVHPAQISLQGSGSGLDADLLDGQQGSYYLDTSATSQTKSGELTADKFISSNNGNGTNFKLGDDAWIGDINVANTFRISGAQNSDRGYITFGNDNTSLGRVGTGALTWGSNLLVQGNGTFSSSSSSAFVLNIDGLGESYNGVSGSGKGAYNVAGTLAIISATPNSVNSGALIDFNAYNSSGGATGAFIGAVAGSTGNGPANFVIGRRTGTTSWAESVRVDTTGKFGINTNAPLQTLDVRGNFLLAADGTTSTHITQKPYTINNGTLSWEGSAGQLFSITNNLTSGSIFSVNDVSGIPSIDVDANGTILFAPYGGNIGVGTLTPAQKLHVIGSIIASSDIIINQSAISYSSSDNTAVVGSITANKLHVNGSIQLTGDNDAIVFGRGTSSFMKDEEIGFGWGGGWYMTDSTFLRVRGSKTLYNDYIIRSDFDVRAPIFRDQDDPTNYYIDPASTSNIRYLKVNTTGTSSGTRALTIKSDGQSEINFGSYPSNWTSALQIQNIDNTDIVWISPLDDGYNARFRTGGCGLDFYTDGTTTDTGTFSAFIGGGYVAAPSFRDSSDTNYYLDPASTSNIKNIQIEPQSAAWAEGIQFYMPSSTTWGGVRWVRNRTNYNGSWYIGYTALDATDDMVFGCQNSGTQIDNIMRLYNSALGSATQGVRVSRDLYVSGNASGNYGNRLVVGNTDTSYTIQDGNFRPTIQAHGQYPVVSLNHTVTGNPSHGPTLQFTCNGTGNQFVIGTSGNGTFLSMGYSNAGDWNPHNGIAGYNGTSFFHAGTDGYIGLGAQGDWSQSGGSGSNVPGYNLHFIGSNNATGGHAALFDNRVNAANNGSGFLFRNLYSNHSWGIVAEYRVEANGGSDRPSILFSTGYNSNTWSVGFGYTDDNFRIKYDHGHRNSGWGTSALEIDRSSNVWAFGSVRSPIFRDQDDPTNYYVDPSGTSRFVALETVGGTYNVFRTWTDLPGHHGFYSSVHNGAHFYPNNGSYGSWRIEGTRDGWRGLNFENAVVLMMNDNESGHHRNGYGWQFRWNDGTMYCHKNGQGGGTSATMWDSSNAPRASNSQLMYYQGFTLDANTMDTNATGFTYSVNAPYTGPIVRFSTGSGAGYDLWLNSPYGSNGYGLAFRTRNGDTGSLNSWQYPAVYGVNVNGGGALYSTIYYDQNNTDYYCDPNGTSELSAFTSGTYTRMDLPFRKFNRQAYTSDSNYWTGTRGWGATFTWDGAWSYGFGGFDIWGTSTGHPQGSGYIHAQGIQSGLHYATSDNSSAYGWQLVGAHDAGTRLWYRGKWGGSTSAWYELAMYGVNVGGDLYATTYYDSNDPTNVYADFSSTSDTAVRINGGLWVSRGNVTGVGIVLADDGDIVDLNDAYCSMRFTSGVRIFSANRGGSAVITLGSNGNVTANAYYGDGSNLTNITAATATNISNTGTVTLASATEANSIYVTQPSYTTDQPVKLLNFDWYGNVWSLGNIRSGSTPSNGFGVYSSGTERARFTTSGLSAASFTSTSDIKLKTNIQPIQSSLAKLFELNGVTFEWKESKEPSIGVIAQDVEKVFPELVQEVSDHKTVNYNGLVAVLIEALKEQQEQIDELKKAIKTHK